MLAILALIFPFFAIILIGYLSGKIKPLGRDALAWMNFFIIYIALPPLFFLLIVKTPIEQFAHWEYGVATTLGTLTIYLTSLVIGMIFSKGNLREAAIQGFCGGYGNIGYIGIGLCYSLFGQAAAIPIALVFCLDNILHFIMAPLLMSLASSDGASRLQIAYQIAKRVFLHPFIIATLVGLIGAFFEVTLPALLDDLLSKLAGAAAPSALFVLGVTLASQGANRFSFELPVHLTIKLVVHPLFIMFLLWLFGPFPPIWVAVAVIMASLPVALNVFVLAEQYDVYVEHASTSILVSTFLSVITVTFFIWLISPTISNLFSP